MSAVLTLNEVRGLLGSAGKPVGRALALRWALSRFRPVLRRPYLFRRSDVLRELGVTE